MLYLTPVSINGVRMSQIMIYSYLSIIFRYSSLWLFEMSFTNNPNDFKPNVNSLSWFFYWCEKKIVARNPNCFSFSYMNVYYWTFLLFSILCYKEWNIFITKMFNYLKISGKSFFKDSKLGLFFFRKIEKTEDGKWKIMDWNYSGK